MSNALPNLKGRVAFIFEERDFDVDQIIGVKNIKIQDVDELAALAMQSYDPQFQSKVRKGDVLVEHVEPARAEPFGVLAELGITHESRVGGLGNEGGYGIQRAVGVLEGVSVDQYHEYK